MCRLSALRQLVSRHLTPVHKQRAGALAALGQQYCLAGDAASAASRLVCFMHLLGSLDAGAAQLDNDGVHASPVLAGDASMVRQTALNLSSKALLQ